MATLKKRTRNFIIGSQRFILSTVEFKSAMLRGLISMLSFFVGVLYVFIDLFNEVHTSYYWYVVLMALSTVAFILNRRQHYVLSNIVLMIMSNGLVYVFASSEDPAGGTFFYFLTIGLGAMVLFGFKRRKAGYFFAGVSVILALIAYLADLPVMPPRPLTSEYIRVNFVTNFCLAFAVSALIIYFLIELHHDIESYLKASKYDLIKVSEELKQSRERFKMAVDGSKAGIYEWDKLNNSIYISPHYKRMLGYAENDLKDLTFEKYLSMIHPDDMPMVSEAMRIHYSKQEPYQTELRIKTKDDSYKWVSDSGISVFREGEAVLTVGSIIDIDERKKAEQKIRLQNEMLAKANEELDRFVYSASHDMRAPLSSLLGLVTIAEKTDNQQEVLLCLEMMKKRVRAMEGFIREITDYSRNSRLAIEQKKVNVASLVNEVVDELKFSSGAERIGIHVNIPADLELLTDINRLKVVLNNLIANAIKHHDTGKQNQFINILASVKGDRLSMSVEDNGQGIDREHIDNIFNMFYRASESSDGSGLGLYIVKETIEKLSGSIKVRSEKGAGSVFTVDLPAAERTADQTP